MGNKKNEIIQKIRLLHCWNSPSSAYEKATTRLLLENKITTFFRICKKNIQKLKDK